MRPPFFIFHRLTPAVPASSPPPGPALTPPTHRQSPTRRHKRPTLACPTTSSPAPKPTAHTHLLPRLPAPPLPDRHKKAAPGTGTATLHPHPRPHQGKAPEPAPTHPHPRPPAPLSDSLLTRPTQAPPLATPQRPKKRHPASRRPPPRAFPLLQVPPLPGRHKKSGSPLKAAALRSNRRAISYP